MSFKTTLSRCITTEHWSHLFTIRQNDIVIKKQGLSQDLHFVNLKLSKKQRGCVYVITSISSLILFPLSPVVAPLMLALLASAFKERKITQSKKTSSIPTPQNPRKSNTSPNNPSVTPTSIVKPNNHVQAPVDPTKQTKAPKRKRPPLLPDPGRLPPPPAQGITAGLPNIGNTCWLNSVLKLLACTDSRDGLFDVDVKNLPKTVFRVSLDKDEAYQQRQIRSQKARIAELQRTLKVMVYTLRTQSKGIIDETLCERLAKALPILMPGNNILSFDQQEASEALLLLESRFGWPSYDQLKKDNPSEETKNKFYQSVTLYSSENRGVFRRARVHDFQMTISLSLNPKDDNNELLNIGDFFRKQYQGDLLDCSVKFKLGNEKQDNEVGTFTKEEALVNLPKTLSINIQRNYHDEAEALIAYSQNREPAKKKSKRDIDLSPNATILLYEHDPDLVGFEDDSTKMNIVPRFACEYQVAAAIIHGGGAGGGHYTCLEITERGDCLYHNDGYVTPLGMDEAVKRCRQATFLNLRLLKKTALTPEEACPIMSKTDVKPCT